MKDFIKKVATIQVNLKAPKSQFNKFGNYSYRNCEDILEAVKPLLKEAGLVLTINDEIVEMGGKIYVKSTSTITDGDNKLSNSAFAREAEEAKGMSPSQITGSTSSYAKKYSLNGLFLIDDTKDADATSTHGKDTLVVEKFSTTNSKVTIANDTVTSGVAVTNSPPLQSKPAPSFRRPTKTTTTPVTNSGDDL
jgi:hypothetical protein